VHDMILDPKLTGQLPEVIAEGAYYGMQTFDQHLLHHLQAGRITFEDALHVATSPHDFKLMVAAQENPTSETSPAPAPHGAQLPAPPEQAAPVAPPVHAAAPVAPSASPAAHQAPPSAPPVPSAPPAPVAPPVPAAALPSGPPPPSTPPPGPPSY